MAEINNKVLLDLIAEMEKNATVDAQEAVLNEIVTNAKFLIPAVVTEIPPEEAKNLKNPEHNTRIKFSMITNDKNENYFPAFTSMEELYKWQEDYNGNTLTLGFDQYAQMLAKSNDFAGMVIDPFTHSLIIDNRMAEELSIQKSLYTKGSAKRILKDGEKIRISHPEVTPTEMIEAMKAHLVNEPCVEKAYLRMMTKENNAESYLLAVDFKGDMEKVFPEIAAAARPYLSGKFMDIVPADTGLGKSVADSTEPFYTK